MTLSRRAVHTAYYAAHTGKSLLWTASDHVTIYALVILFGIDADVAGWVFLAGLAANALADLTVGEWLDRHPDRARWLAAIGLIGAALSFPATILAAPHGPMFLLAVTLAFRLAYAAYDVPHNAMMSRLTMTAGAEAAVATQLSRGRTTGTGVAAAAIGLALWRWREAQLLPEMLWLIAGAAMLLGTALLPLLPRTASIQAASAPSPGPGLPMGFLLGSLLGIVALGALTKAMLQLPMTIEHPDAGTTVLLLTGGRTLAALLPLRVGNAHRGLSMLSVLYIVAVPVMATLLWMDEWPMLLVLGLLLGSTNLIAWALLPLLARGARSYGLYTMAAKLALGGAGLLMTVALGESATFAPGPFITFVAIMLTTCGIAAWCIWPRRPPNLAVERKKADA